MASFTDTGSTRGPADVGRVATRRMDAGGDVSESRDGRRDLPGRMGRFVVLETLGEGGMGQVLAAYDPVLDRRVALKRLRSAGDDAGLARLRREARAMARLSHPGVVAVHDVLEVDGDVLVAMEYVEGQTLREWLGDGERPWTAVVKAMGEAGEGLAAAHAAGLVHRDFKPDNVLVGEDQRVQVTDFGLAIMMAEAEIPSTLSRPAVAESGLTQTGALLGTPRYMAPEQFRGEPADARSDQFSFCVSLYQALYGQDPFEGKTLAALEHAVLEDEPHSPPSDRGVPGWLGTVVLRGLARDPAARWPSMRALVAELSRERRRGRWLSAAGAGLLLASAGTWWSLAGTEDQRCTGAPRELAPLWSEPRQQRLRAVMQETALPGAEATWTVVQRGVQAWADDWQSGYTDACQAHLRGEQSDRVLDRRMACLDRQRRSVGAALRVLEQPDARVLRRAPRAVGELPVPSDCTQVERLAAVESWFEDPALAGRRDDLRDRLAKLAAEATWAGRFKDAIAGYGAMLDALDPIPAPALRAELLYQRGSARSVSDSIDAAKADLLAAYAQAERARVDPLKARIAADLVELVPRRGLALPDVDAWAALALAIVERAEPNGGAHGHVLSALAKLRHHQGRYEDALALARHAQNLYTEAHGPMHNRVAVTMSTQAISLVALGRDAEAIPLYQAANERIAANLGPGHIDVASGQYNLGGMEMRRGNPAVARQHFDRALEIWEQALGPTHTRVAAAWFGLAWVEEEEDDLDAAQTAYERAVAIWEAHPDIEAGNFAAALNNLALLYARQGDPRRALTMLERSARVEADTHGREHPAYAQALGTTAKIHLMLGESQRAEALAREAAQQLRQTLGPTHAKLASVLETLAEALRRLDRAAEAEPLLNEVLAIAGDDPQFLGTRARLALVRIDRGDLTGATAALDAMPTGADARAEMSPGVRAAVDFATARLSTDPQQRQQLAGRAIAALEQAGTDAPVPVEEVQHWLETSHAPRP